MRTGAENAQNPAETDRKRLLMLEQVGTDAPSCLGVFRTAFASKSKAAAVKAFCLQCAWMDREAIRSCTATACPLWNVRPFQRGGGRGAAAGG